MARRNPPRRDDDNLIFSSEQNLEKQADLMEKMADKVSDHIESRFESIADRIDNRLNKEVSGLQRQLANQSKRQRENEEKMGSIRDNFLTNVMNQTGRGQAFDTNWKSVGATIGKEIANCIIGIFNTYITKPIQQGFSEMSSAYESNFTEIAGRMGTNQKNTYNEMKDAVRTLSNSTANSAINANKELIPELRKVAESGFKGQQAVSVALDNAIDAKIMPWLDTHSDAWTNLQFNLTTNQLQMLKGQQLALQESKQGNRLLQSGVINTLTSELSPILTNIDLNTGGAQNLGVEAQAHLQSLLDQGYSPQEAYQMVQDTIRAWKDPWGTLEKGDYKSVMQFQAAYNGGDYSDVAKAPTQGYQIAVNAGRDYGAVAHELGLTTGTDVVRAEEGERYLNTLTNIETYIKNNPSSSASLYQQAAENVAEKVTKTTAWDNTLENGVTNALYPLNNLVAHGIDLVSQIASTVSKILQTLIGFGIGKLVTGVVGGNNGGGLIGQVLKGTLSRGGATAASEGGSLLLEGATAEGGALLAGEGGALIAGGEGVATAGAEGIAAGGSVAGPIALAALANMAMIAGGVTEAGYGGYQAYKEFSQVDYGGGNIQGENEAHIKSGTMAAGAGALGGLGAAAIILGNPIGQLALVTSAGLLVAKKLYDVSTTIGGSAKSLSAAYDEQIKSLKTSNVEQRSMLSQIQLNLKNSNDIEAQRTELINSGLLSEADLEKAREANKEGLESLTEKYIEASKKFDSEGTALLNKYKASDKAAAKEGQVDVRNWLNDLYENGTDAQKATGSEEMQAAGSIFEAMYADLSSQDPNSMSKQNKKLLDKLEDIVTDTSGKYRTRSGQYTAKSLNAVADLGFWNDTMKEATFSNETVESMYGYMAEARPDLAKKSIDIHGEDRTATVAYAIQDLNLAESQEEAKSIFEELKSQGITSDEYSELKSYMNKFGLKGYAVGSPYISQDQLAILHKGESVITAAENKSNLLALLGIKTDQIEAQKTSAEDIIKAIQAQTEALKAVLEQLGVTISRPSNKVDPYFGTFSSTIGDNVSLVPSIANTRAR